MTQRINCQDKIQCVSKELQYYQAVWNNKPVLRTVYANFYDRIVGHCLEGSTLEIGSGVGSLRQRFSDIVSSDIQYAPWLDVVADAQRLPFCKNSFNNIVMVDVLHHIEHTTEFFKESSRLLKTGGRIVAVEPAITPLSWLFYKFLHVEPVLLSANPLTTGTPNPSKNPYHSNQAIPTLIVTSYKERFQKLFPELMIKDVVWFSPVSYPLSGGFKSWSLMTPAGIKRLIRFEAMIERLLGHFLGFRLLIVFEKIKEI